MVDVPVVKTPQQALQGDTVSLLAVVKTLLALSHADKQFLPFMLL